MSHSLALFICQSIHFLIEVFIRQLFQYLAVYMKNVRSDCLAHVFISIFLVALVYYEDRTRFFLLQIYKLT